MIKGGNYKNPSSDPVSMHICKPTYNPTAERNVSLIYSVPTSIGGKCQQEYKQMRQNIAE